MKPSESPVAMRLPSTPFKCVQRKGLLPLGRAGVDLLPPDGCISLVVNVPDIKVAFSVYTTEYTRMGRTPLDIKDILLGALEGLNGLFTFIMPKIDSPIEGTSQ